MSSNKYILPTLAFVSLGAAAYYALFGKKKKFTVVFVLGGPGAGKGTQCAKIVDKYGFVHLSAGDLLRAEKASGSSLADMINTYINEGKIVPAEVTVRLLLQAMEKHSKFSNIGLGCTKFLVDGFPRDPDNLKCWEEVMTSLADVKFLLFLDCPQDIMIDRLLERGKTSGRSDDTRETIKKRFVTYENSTRPIIDKFASLGKMKQVNSNQPVDVVFSGVSKCFDEI